jgi:hypothetical protein
MLLKYERNAVIMMLQDSSYAILLVSLSIIFTAIYIVLLPSLPNGTISITFVQFITPLQIIFSILFGSMLGLIITLNVYAARSKIKTPKRAPTIAFISTFVNVLCCTPLIPSVFTFLGASTSVLFTYSPKIQSFFEQNYPYFYLVSFLLFFASFHYASKNIFCCKVVDYEKHM